MNYFRAPIVLLDLDCVLVDDWSAPNPVILSSRVSQIISSLRRIRVGVQLGLFSDAVSTSEDKARFVSELRPLLEAELRTKFCPSWLLSQQEWAEQAIHASLRNVSVSDLMAICDRGDLFGMLVRHHPEWQARQVCLFDATLPSATLEIKDKNLKATIIKMRDQDFWGKLL